MVAEAVQDWPAVLVPWEMTARLSSTGLLTTALLVCVGAPTSIPNSFQAKLPSPEANVDLIVITPAATVGNVASRMLNQRLVEPAAADRSVWPTAAAVEELPTPIL